MADAPKSAKRQLGEQPEKRRYEEAELAGADAAADQPMRRRSKEVVEAHGESSGLCGPRGEEERNGHDDGHAEAKRCHR